MPPRIPRDPSAASAHRRRYAGPLVALLLVATAFAGPVASPAAAAVSCTGAAAMAAGPTLCPPTTSGVLTPTATAAFNDRSDAWLMVNGTDCFAHTPTFPLTTCQRGYPASGAVGHVAVIGNSHAGHWLSAIEQIAMKRRWAVTTYLGSGCASADLAQNWPTPETVAACQAWAEAAAARVAHGGYGLVIMSNKVYSTALGYDLPGSWLPYQRGYTKTLQTLASTNRRVLVIRDTPSATISVPTCLSRYPNYSVCNGTPATWVRNDPTIPAVAALKNPHIQSVDLTKYFCTSTVCYAAIGRIPVYFDSSHVAASYAVTVAPYLEPALMRVIYS